VNIFDHAYLKEIEESDLDLILQWRNQEHIRNVMFDSRIITMEDHKKWYEKNRISKQASIKIFYIGDVPLGIINITNIDRQNDKCDWGFYIGASKAPKGSGTIMGYLALNHIFYEKKIRKLCAQVLNFNLKSLEFHKRLGFKSEGILRQHIKKNNIYVDVINFALFKNEWDEKSQYIRIPLKG
jgi:UDP-4-amino-4,6-dideoxy-N-acetyl-beta-L-altrosamine N-acetyltransferase